MQATSEQVYDQDFCSKMRIYIILRIYFDP